MTARRATAAEGLPRILVLMGDWFGHGRRMLEGVVEYARRHARWELAFRFPPQPRPADDTLDSFPRLDGLIIEGISAGAVVRRARRRRLPTVVVGGECPVKAVPHVVPDREAIGRLAFEHLRDQGFQVFAASRTEIEPYARPSERAFALEVRRAGFPYHPLDLTQRTPFVPEPIPAALDAWLRSVPKPIGVFVPVIVRAAAVAHACRAAGILIPERVAIVGAEDDDMLANLFTPPLTTVYRGIDRLGYRAAEVLDALLRGRPAPAEPLIVPPVGVITRQSSDTLAVADERVAQAVRFIRDHVDDRVAVRDVVRHVPIARRTLEYAFGRALGRTIQQEIMRTRVERARQLLAETDMPLPDIAVRSGFLWVPHLCTVLQRATGKTPKQYRQTFRRMAPMPNE